MKKVAIIGAGYVGSAYKKLFDDAVVYDEPKAIGNRADVNACDMALVCVPTNLKEDGGLDMSIVEEVVGWLETPLILIKSALMPGTVDRLVAGTGKRIAVSPEFIGEGKYTLPFWKYPHPTDPTLHQFLIVGGDEGTATACAGVVWERMSPDLDIHIVSALEAEICKLMENSWGALKVSFANEMETVCRAYGANYTKVLQAWGADGRVEKMHMRVLAWKRGWKSKCWDKDVPALIKAAALRGVDFLLLKAVLASNTEHLKTSDQ